MSKLLSELAVGAKVKFGKYQVNTETPEPIVWTIVAKNHTGYPANAITLHTSEVIDLRCFDAKELNSTNEYRKQYGNQRYSVSNIDQWLNSNAAAGTWYTPQHQYDVLPNSYNVSGNPSTAYSERPGFLNYFTSLEQTAILSSTIRVIKTNYDGGGYEDISRKVFLASLTELGLTNDSNVAEGGLWEYYSNNTSRIAYRSQQCLTNSLWQAKPTAGDSYWTRTPGRSHPAYIYYISSSGTGAYGFPYIGYYGVRPALNLSSALKISDAPDTEGCYTIDLTPDPAPTPTATFTATSDNGGTLANVTTAMKYSVNGGTTWKSISKAKITVKGITPANGIQVKEPGNGTTTTDSEIQTITVTQAETPNLTATQPSVIGGKGSIPMSTSHEYSTDQTTWAAATGATELVAGTYYVRVKASGTVLASPSQTIVLTAFTGTPEPTPNAVFTAIGDSSGTLTDVVSGMEYSLDGGTNWVAIQGASVDLTEVTPTNGVKVRKPGNGTTTTGSEVQTIAVTQAPTPNLEPTQPSTVGGKGAIPMTSVHEYSIDKVTWVTATGVTILEPGTYYVRVKAAGAVLASDIQTITLIPCIEPPTPDPHPDPKPEPPPLPTPEPMPCIPREIKDRIAIGDDCFRMEQLEDGRVKLIPVPDSITEAGTNVNRELLQLIEDRVALLMNRVFDGITSNPFIYTFTILSGLTVTGIWNEHARRIEC